MSNQPKDLGSHGDQIPAQQHVDEDSDPGYEDLDDILDQFNTAAAANKSDQQHAVPPTSGAERPPITSQPSSQSEAEFMAQLQADLTKTMTELGVSSESEAKNEAKEITDMGKELEEFTRKMEEEGLQPEDLIRAILGEEGIDPSTIKSTSPSAGTTKQTSGAAAPASGSSSSIPKPPPTTSDPISGATSSTTTTTFEDTIRRTMERMQASDSRARDAQHEPSDNDQDILAQLMKAMESADPSGSAGGDSVSDNDLSNLFLNMMQQLTSKELLYEPMKELDSKFPDWLEKNDANLKQEDRERYQSQRTVVREIVEKFEDPNYSDDNEKDRAFVWEKMQTMQSAGSPPEDLITAPFPGAFGPGGAEAGDGQDPIGGCPTQ